MEGKQQNKDNNSQRPPTLSAQAYALFLEGKTPIQVAIDLNLREAEATKYYKEHWRLKQLNNLNLIYEDIRDDILPIVKLYRRIKVSGIQGRTSG